ncbi:very short patch repair endonuclease [Pseudomonas fluorescens]|uniref:Very short patch repair endonuclease n=1 Tax=Pseudomonas fluorescens TaxID=294 RepID=A0A345V162_PSEFL|nr:very short patch repair endonuclease [Pseudomonas fluorescens]AXJ06464.1 very short patch repair endonuclease [Pseudomonas fluorescens]
MTDVLSPEQRKLNMSRIRGSDTKPEMLIRRSLHARGFRYRLHDRELPGSPDLVFPRYHAVIFVNGCFWHGHNCPMFKLPSTRPEFWLRKIESNRVRDNLAIETLLKLGWRVANIWECSTKGPSKLTTDEILSILQEFLLDEKINFLDISGLANKIKHKIRDTE